MQAGSNQMYDCYRLKQSTANSGVICYRQLNLSRGVVKIRWNRVKHMSERHSSPISNILKYPSMHEEAKLLAYCSSSHVMWNMKWRACMGTLV